MILFGTNNVDRKDITMWADDSTSQSLRVQLRKDTTHGLHMAFGNLTLTADRHARINFDLLIDNEQPVTP